MDPVNTFPRWLVLLQADSLSQRPPEPGDFIDLTVADNAVVVVDLTEADDIADLPIPATTVKHSPVRTLKRKRDETFNQIPETMSDGAIQEVNQKEMDRITRKLDKLCGYLSVANYSFAVGNARMYNATAYCPGSHLDAPPHMVPPPGVALHQATVANVMAGLPGYPDPNLEVPALPTTVRGIMTLTKAKLTHVENYYGLSHEGKVAERRERIKKSYGIGLHRR